MMINDVDKYTTAEIVIKMVWQTQLFLMTITESDTILVITYLNHIQQPLMKFLYIMKDTSCIQIPELLMATTKIRTIVTQ